MPAREGCDFISVFAVGQSVVIGGDLQATVTGINIRGIDHVQYECSWWDGRSHYCKWLDACEVTSEEQPSRMIGFGTRDCGLRRRCITGSWNGVDADVPGS